MEGLSPPGLAKIERVQFHWGPAFSNLQVVPAQNKQKQEGMAKTDVSAASLRFPAKILKGFRKA